MASRSVLFVVLAVGVLALKTMASSPRKSSGCPSENWEVDTQNNRCLLAVTSAMTYKSAALACRVLGTQIASVSMSDNHDQLRAMLTLSPNHTYPVPLWSKYHIVQRNGRFYLADDQDQVIEGSAIMGHLYNNNTRLCIRSSLSGDLKRTRVNCNEKYHFMCEYHLTVAVKMEFSKRGLAALAIALAICLAFTIVAALEICHRLRVNECKRSEDDMSDKTPISLSSDSQDGVSLRDDKDDVFVDFEYISVKPAAPY